MAGETKYILNASWGQWTCLQGCKQGCQKVKVIYTTKKSVDWHGLSIRFCGYGGNANENYLDSFQLERGQERSLGPTRKYTNNFSIDQYLYKKGLFNLNIILFKFNISTTNSIKPCIRVYQVTQYQQSIPLLQEYHFQSFIWSNGG